MSFQLEVRLHLVNGNVQAFRQSEPEAVEQFLEKLFSPKVFSSNATVIWDQESTTIVTTRHIARIEVRGSSLKSSFHLPEHFGAELLTYAEFTHEKRLADSPSAMAGNALVEIEMECSEVIYLRILTPLESSSALELGMMFQRIGSSPTMVAKIQDGGIAVINPAHIVRSQIHPSIPEAPAGCWHLSSASEA